MAGSAASRLENYGFIEVEGNTYGTNLFQQRGTGTFRLYNRLVNSGQAQTIYGSNSYAVRGGQSSIGVDDGSFYNLDFYDVGQVLTFDDPQEAIKCAEVFAQRQSLVGKTVVVRGKVMKFLPEIMKKNWIHLQDGTGDEKAKTHDLTFTTADTVAAGDVVTLKGTLRLNKDFGSGYTYEVIVEEAKVQK